MSYSITAPVGAPLAQRLSVVALLSVAVLIAAGFAVLSPFSPRLTATVVSLVFGLSVALGAALCLWSAPTAGS